MDMRIFALLPVQVLLLLVMLAGPTCPLLAVEFTVNSEADTSDASPGNGQCLSAGGECTLRAAIQEANALEGPDRIELPAGNYVLSVGEIDLTSELECDINARYGTEAKPAY